MPAGEGDKDGAIVGVGVGIGVGVGVGVAGVQSQETLTPIFMETSADRLRSSLALTVIVWGPLVRLTLVEMVSWSLVALL